MNKIILLGRLTKDTEIVTTTNMTMIGKFTLAVQRKFAKEDEEKQTDYFNVVTFGKQAEFASKYFKKGQRVLVFGKAEINSYENENGETRFAFQVKAEELDFADGKKDDNEEDSSNNINYEELYDNGPVLQNSEENSEDDEEDPF